MRLQRGLDSLWSWLGEDRRGLEILVLLLLLNVLVFIIPQTPVTHGDSVAQLRWLAQTSATWYGPLRVLDTFHLTRIRSSLWMRLPLAWLALVTASHIDKLRGQWENIDSRARIKSLSGKIGGVLVMLGWVLQILFGWTVPALTAWPDSPMDIPERNISVPSCTRWACLWPGKMGLYLLPAGDAVGVDVQAEDSNGTKLELVPAAKTEPQLRLQITLTDPAAETFFLIPAVERIVQISENVAGNGESGLSLQAYDFQSGALLAEETISHNTVVRVGVELVTINVAVRSLAQYDAIYNPGALVEVLGFMLMIIGLILVPKQSATEEESPNEAEQEGE